GSHEVGVAELAGGPVPVALQPGPQVATGKAQEDCRTPGLPSFALQGVEARLDAVHIPKIARLGPIPSAARQGRVSQAQAPEPLLPEQAGVALATGEARRCRIVATAGQSVVHSGPHARSDDLVLGQLDQGGVNGEVVDGGAQAGGLLECGDELGATV